MKLSEEQSRGCYRAAYRGLTQSWTNGFDVVIDLDDPDCRGSRERMGAAPIVSGIRLNGDTLVWKNVDVSQFGDWDISETTEEEFVAGCMEAFGCVELEER